VRQGLHVEGCRTLWTLGARRVAATAGAASQSSHCHSFSGPRPLSPPIGLQAQLLATVVVSLLSSSSLLCVVSGWQR
jgi:hypothetical protein